MEIVETNVKKDERETFIENIVGFSWNNTNLHPSTEQLMKIYKNNKYNDRKTYTFFTDGSMKKQENQAEMGIGWVQIENNEEINKFNAKTKGWPSSTRAEMIAILTTLLVTKNSSILNIHTDSQNTINIFNSYKYKYTNYRSYIKLENQIIWELIFQVIKILDLDVILHKLKHIIMINGMTEQMKKQIRDEKVI